jgi:hypothetical protein
LNTHNVDVVPPQDLSSKKPPKRVILLDHYCVQSVCDEAPVFTFSLRRDPTLGVDNTEVAMTVYSVAGLARRSKDIDPLYHISSKDLDTHQKWIEAVQSKASPYLLVGRSPLTNLGSINLQCVNAEPTKVFGVELNTIMARKREANNKIPSMLEKCIAYLDRYGTAFAAFHLLDIRNQTLRLHCSAGQGGHIPDIGRRPRHRSLQAGLRQQRGAPDQHLLPCPSDYESC